MNDDKEKWMEEVFQSMKGSRRAKPRPELFAKIEGQIAVSKGKVIPLRQWKYAAAVAALVLFVNVKALLYSNQNDEVFNDDAVVADVYNQPLISSYQIYE